MLARRISRAPVQPQFGRREQFFYGVVTTGGRPPILCLVRRLDAAGARIQTQSALLPSFHLEIVATGFESECELVAAPKITWRFASFRGGRPGAQYSDDGQLPHLLSMRHERLPRRRNAEQVDELAPPHATLSPKMMRPEYQMISHKALRQLLRRSGAGRRSPHGVTPPVTAAARHASIRSGSGPPPHEIVNGLPGACPVSPRFGAWLAPYTSGASVPASDMDCWDGGTARCSNADIAAWRLSTYAPQDIS
jgi:hypothetical protein